MSKTIRKEHLGDWIQNQRPWARDALRRLSLDELDENDMEEILINLKKNNGIEPDKEPVWADFTDDLFKTQLPNDTSKTLLCSISPLKNVNRLADGQVMNFALSGLTLIYGDNGSGKSGYCRISKKLCRARVPEDIVDNAYKDGEHQKAEVKITYQFEGEKPIPENWIDGETAPPESLSRLAVFDAACARFYVDEDNKIEYLPAEIELLNRHTDLLKYLRNKLKLETNTLEEQVDTPFQSKFIEGTEASELIARLKLETPFNDLPKEQEIKDFAIWSDADDNKITTLEKQIAEDPEAKLSKLETLKKIMVNLSQQISVVEVALCKVKIDELAQAFNLAESTAQVVETNATGRFKNDLPGTGTDPWKKMYEYATEYAKTIEGTNNKIPSEIDELCILCQQKLDQEASDRLKKFEEFVANKASKDAKSAHDDLKEKTNAIGKINIRSEKEYELLLEPYIQLNEKTKTITSNIKIFFTEASQLLATLNHCIENNKFIRPEISITIISSKLNEYMTALEAGIERLKGECANASRLNDLKKNMNELNDKKKFSEGVQSFIKRLEDLHLLEKLKKCRGELVLGKVSSKIKSLGNEILDGELQKDIGAELKALKLAHIPFKIKNKIDDGGTLVAMDLITRKPISKQKILSEGEQRALALACFLAEVKRDPIKHGIIIDDPVSSLDHTRIERVAKRLVAEAKDKQVIIFTHNILFYKEVRNLATEHKIPCLEHYMYKVDNEQFGMIGAANRNWQAMSVQDRISVLDELAENIKTTAYKDDEARRVAVKDFYTNLRETWERLVEQILLNKVVRRYTSAVQTKSLAGVMVKDSDFERIYWAMKHVSKYSGHDKSVSNTHPLPDQQGIEKDIKTIKDFKKEITDRRKLVSDDRNASVENPPPAQTIVQD